MIEDPPMITSRLTLTISEESNVQGLDQRNKSEEDNERTYRTPIKFTAIVKTQTTATYIAV